MFKLIDRASACGATLLMAQAVQHCAMPNGPTAPYLFPVSTDGRAASGLAPR